MRQSKTRLGPLLAGVLLLPLLACGGPAPPVAGDAGSSEDAPPCGNLASACPASAYCLVSSVPRPGQDDVILTSACEPFPPARCPTAASREDVCACLAEEAQTRNDNCARPGATLSCEVQTRSGITSPRFTLTCGVRP